MSRRPGPGPPAADPNLSAPAPPDDLTTTNDIVSANRSADRRLADLGLLDRLGVERIFSPAGLAVLGDEVYLLGESGGGIVLFDVDDLAG